jgi:hypothetical protein
MQIRETIDNPSTASTEDVITLVDSAGVALGVQHAFSAKTRAVRPGGVSIASRWVEIPLVGPERQDHRRTREGLPARGRRLTDRRRLTCLWKRLPAQARPVITRANNSKLPTTTTALDQPEPNQASKCISNGQDRPSCFWHSKQHQEEARFCCLLRVTFQSLTRLTGISH